MTKNGPRREENENNEDKKINFYKLKKKRLNE